MVNNFYKSVVLLVFLNKIIHVKKILDDRVALNLLYQLSIVEDAKAMVAFTDLIKVVRFLKDL